MILDSSHNDHGFIESQWFLITMIIYCSHNDLKFKWTTMALGQNDHIKSQWSQWSFIWITMIPKLLIESSPIISASYSYLTSNQPSIRLISLFLLWHNRLITMIPQIKLNSMNPNDSSYSIIQHLPKKHNLFHQQTKIDKNSLQLTKLPK
jgi:hypothetical protein